MVREARAGRIVVRLKGGDPAIFARLAEELAALEAAGVPYEIVPGVTAAEAASSHAGIPLTDRDAASCVAFVTGQERSDKAAEDSLDFAALAQFPGTLVFYMGLTTAPEWSRELMAHGKSRVHARGHRPPLHVRRSANDLHDAGRRRRTLGARQVASAGRRDRRRRGPRALARELVHGAAALRPDECSSRGRPISPTG